MRKTQNFSKEDMINRTSFFKNLNPLPIQIDQTIPQSVKDIVYARELLSVIGLGDNNNKTPINKNAIPTKIKKHMDILKKKLDIKFCSDECDL